MCRGLALLLCATLLICDVHAGRTAKTCNKHSANTTTEAGLVNKVGQDPIWDQPWEDKLSILSNSDAGQATLWYASTKYGLPIGVGRKHGFTEGSTFSNILRLAGQKKIQSNNAPHENETMVLSVGEWFTQADKQLMQWVRPYNNCQGYWGCRWSAFGELMPDVLDAGRMCVAGGYNWCGRIAPTAKSWWAENKEKSRSLLCKGGDGVKKLIVPYVSEEGPYEARLVIKYKCDGGPRGWREVQKFSVIWTTPAKTWKPFFKDESDQEVEPPQK